MARKIGITLDPGHAWNYNPGVVKPYYESNVMYDLAVKLKGYLEATGIFDVSITKSSLQTNPSLAERGQFAINKKSRMFLSLHSNACNSESVKYVVTYASVARKSTDKFVQNFTNEVAKTLGQWMDGGCKANTNNYRKNSSGTDYYGVLRSCAKSGVCQYIFLIEHSFHTNKSLCNALLDSKHVDALAKRESELIYAEMKKYYIDSSMKTYTGTATATVNIRPNASTADTALGSLAKGKTIPVVCKTGSWYQVIYNNAAAYISAQYLTVSGSVPNQSAMKYVYPTASGSTTTASTPAPETPSTPVSWEVLPNITAKVNCSSGLNMREEASTTSKKIRTLLCGTVVGVMVREDNDPNTNDLRIKSNGMYWYRVTHKVNGADEVGWCCADYLDLSLDTCPKATVKVSNDTLNYREKPSMNGKVVGTLKNGATVYTLGTAGKIDGVEWMKIVLNAKSEDVYYVSSAYLQEVVPYKPEMYMDCGFGQVATAATIYSTPTGGEDAAIGSVAANTYLVILSEEGNRYKFINNGYYAYVGSKYVKMISQMNDTREIGEIPSDIADLLEDRKEGNATEWFTKTLGAKVTSPFGPRIHPITGKQSVHYGIDYGAAGGTPIYSNIEGIVVKNAYDSSRGNYIVVMDEMGRQHHYYHMKAKSTLSLGTLVGAGTVLGYVGTTGSSTGNHLHYGVCLPPYATQNWVDPNSINYQ